VLHRAFPHNSFSRAKLPNGDNNCRLTYLIVGVKQLEKTPVRQPLRDIDDVDLPQSWLLVSGSELGKAFSDASSG
jgi:hypothetical protein